MWRRAFSRIVTFRQKEILLGQAKELLCQNVINSEVQLYSRHFITDEIQLRKKNPTLIQRLKRIIYLIPLVFSADQSDETFLILLWHHCMRKYFHVPTSMP